MSNIADIIYLIVAVFVIAITVVLGLYIYDAFFTSTMVTTTFTAEQIAVAAPVRTTIASFDYLAIFIVVGMGVMCIISAYLVRTYPIFFIMMFIAQMIVVGVSSIISNIWYQIAQTSQLVTITNSLTWLPFIFNNLPTIILVFSAAVAIVSYGSPQGNQYAYQ
jgi:hypothetical protein